MGFPRQGYPVCAETNAFGGEGDHVKVTFGIGFNLLDYSVGYDDCLSGCISRRHWKFRVSDDGSVDFLGSSGDAPPTQEMRRS